MINISYEFEFSKIGSKIECSDCRTRTMLSACFHLLLHLLGTFSVSFMLLSISKLPSTGSLLLVEYNKSNTCPGWNLDDLRICFMFEQ